MLPLDSVKRCSGCGEVRPRTVFDKCKTARDGLRGWCNACRLKYNQCYVREHQAKVKEYRRRYRKEHIDKLREKDKRYYAGHREEIRARARAWYWANRDRHLKRIRDRRLKDIEAVRRRDRNYYTANKCAIRQRCKERNYQPRDPEHHRRVAVVCTERRRARKAENGGSFTVNEWQQLCGRYNNVCLCCGCPASERLLTVDHVVPISKGGTSNIDNIQPLCQRCNLLKGTKGTDYRGRHAADTS